MISKELFKKPNNRLEGEQEQPALHRSTPEKADAIDCPECGAAIARDALFSLDYVCPRCGAVLTMFPAVDGVPLDIARLPALEGVLDVIYNPLRTKLIQQAEARGCKCAGGLTMLVWQAVRARELFTGKPVPPETALAAQRALTREVSNLVLIGMPGSGKSTVGKRCAHTLHLPFVDTDSLIEARAGKPIPRVFAEDGEAAFRKIETEVLAEVGSHGGQVIATGGGAVLREENRQYLRMNGIVIRLLRPLGKLSTGGRPLSAGADSLRRMERDRGPCYRACADRTVQNDRALPDCVRQVLEAYHAKDVKMEPNIDFTTIGHATSGASGAELANIINEAALRAVRLGRETVTQTDLEESVEQVIAGYQRKGAVISEKDKKIIAYHEIGHALVAARLKDAAPVHKITIIPRTSGALGYTMKRLSIKQISELSGVSTATVSRVINHNGRFSRETEERVLSVIEKYQYVPNMKSSCDGGEPLLDNCAVAFIQQRGRTILPVIIHNAV